MKSLRRRLGVLLLPLVLALGPGLTLCVHACQVRGTEVSFEGNAHCCKGETESADDGPVFEAAGCCSESDAQLQLRAPVQRPEALVLSMPALVGLADVVCFAPLVVEGSAFYESNRGPPRYISGRSRLISYSIARV
jgi:hypothetical protein